MTVAKSAFGAIAAMLASASPTMAQTNARTSADLTLNAAGYYEAPAANVLVFSNWYDGLFADSKISGVEIIQQGERIATNGDVRLSSTPGQWDAIGRLVDRKVDAATGAITVTLEYPDYQWRYQVRSEKRGGAVAVSVMLDQPVPAALAGKAGFNLEFLPAAYFHHSFMADGTTGTFPIYPADAMTRTPERNAASGRAEGPGAEPTAIASGRRFVLAPEDPARRVTIRSTQDVQLFDGRNQAQNGWFVLRSMLPAGRTGKVLEWTIQPNAVPGWLRAPVIAHSQLGYTPAARKVATIELDRNDRRTQTTRLLRVGEDGSMTPVKTMPAKRWGDYLRYSYMQLDFSDVRAPGTYLLEYGPTRTAPFRIAADAYAGAWHPTLDVYFPVAMDHMYVNEGYRVWHGDAHRDDARHAPVNHEHIDLYAQGPTTDTRYKPGEHIPGLAVGGWFDAGDYDIRTQSQYQVIRSLVDSWERWHPTRDTTAVDWARKRTEIHVPDGTPDLLQQIRHGTLQLVAQFDAVGHAIHGIVEPDVAQYTHLGDASTKTDGLVYDPTLKLGEERGGRSGTPDDRWAFTTKASALNYGSIAGLASLARARRGRSGPGEDGARPRGADLGRGTGPRPRSLPARQHHRWSARGGDILRRGRTAAHHARPALRRRGPGALARDGEAVRLHAARRGRRDPVHAGKLPRRDDPGGARLCRGDRDSSEGQPVRRADHHRRLGRQRHRARHRAQRLCAAQGVPRDHARRRGVPRDRVPARPSPGLGHFVRVSGRHRLEGGRVRQQPRRLLVHRRRRRAGRAGDQARLSREP